MADFFIAQYCRDPIRHEPKNVGVIVVKEADCYGLFLGQETAEGDKDMRTVRWAREPKVYRKWVRFWNEEINRGAEDLFARLADSNSGSYSVIVGGKATDTGNDTAEEICNKLFPMLVTAEVTNHPTR